MAASRTADLVYLRDYFFGKVDSNGNLLAPPHLKELGQALYDMEENQTDPVVAINAVIKPITVDPSAEGEVRKMFKNTTHGKPTGKIMVRETLIDLVIKSGNYHSTKMRGSQPPDPWRA